MGNHLVLVVDSTHELVVKPNEVPPREIDEREFSHQSLEQSIAGKQVIKEQFIGVLFDVGAQSQSRVTYYSQEKMDLHFFSLDTFGNSLT